MNYTILLSTPAIPSMSDIPTTKPGRLAASIKCFVDDQVIAGAVLLIGTSGGVSAIETGGYENVDMKMWI